MQEGPYYSDYAVSSTTVSPAFGASVAVSGGTFVVGAPYADKDQTDQGLVSLYQIRPTHRNAEPRPAEQTLTASDVAAGDRYASAVHVTSDSALAVVGAPEKTVSSVPQAGAAYVLERSASQEWAQSFRLAPPPSRTKWTRRVPHPVLIGHAASLSRLSRLVPSVPAEFARFGTAVASLELAPASRSTQEEYAWHEIAVGAPGETLSNDPPFPRQSQSGQTHERAGAVYIFAQTPAYASSPLAAAVTAGDATMTVESAADLMGISTTVPPPRTKWAGRVPHPVLSGHAASLTPY